MKKLTLTIVALALSSAAQAGFIGTNYDETRLISMEKRESITANVKAAWIQSNHVPENYSTMGRYFADCAASSLAISRVVTYSGLFQNGAVMKDVSVPLDIVEWFEVIPGSTGEIILNAMCKEK